MAEHRRVAVTGMDGARSGGHGSAGRAPVDGHGGHGPAGHGHGGHGQAAGTVGGTPPPGHAELDGHGQRAPATGHASPAERHVGLFDGVPRAVIVLMAGLLTLMLVVTGIGFWLSYESLHRWAEGHGLHAQAAWAWPAVVDSFIGIGELGSATFMWLRRGRMRWYERVSWFFLSVTTVGFAGSLTANMASSGVDPGAQFTAALPPAAALIAFAGLIRVGHEMFDRWQHGHSAMPVGVPAPVPLPLPAPALPVPAERAPVPVDLPVPPVPAPSVPVPAVEPAPARPPTGTRRAVAADRAPRRASIATVTAMPDADDLERRRRDARQMYAASLDAGDEMTVAEMMEATGMKERWCKIQRAEVNKERKARTGT